MYTTVKQYYFSYCFAETMTMPIVKLRRTLVNDFTSLPHRMLMKLEKPGGGDTQIWFGRESAAGASKLLPMFKGHFNRKRYPFLRIFLET